MMTEKLTVIHELSALSANPIARVEVENAEVVVELSDEVKTIRMVFSPYQCVRITTADCFALSGAMFITPRTVLEVIGSEWLEQLKVSQAQIDVTATFLSKSRHFVIPCEDNFIEIVAWSFDVSST